MLKVFKWDWGGQGDSALQSGFLSQHLDGLPESDTVKQGKLCSWSNWLCGCLFVNNLLLPVDIA